MDGNVDRLTPAEYRKFGLITGAIVVVLFGLFLPLLGLLNYPKWPWVFAGVLGTWALVVPATLHPVYSVWMKFGSIMNWINTRLILGLAFYAVFLPFGLVLRLLGKDPMHRKLLGDAETYNVPCRANDRESMEKPY